MQTNKTTRTWAVAAAVAAMLAASARVPAQAQETPAMPSPSNAMSTPGAMSPSLTGGMSGGAMDYHILSNPNYDYVDLAQAKARGLSDNQIAAIAKIAEKTGMPFRAVSAAVERGATFPTLASEYNLRLADIYDVDEEKQRIANYTAAYESINTKNGSSSDSLMGMSGSSSMANMTSTSTMTPSAMTAPMATMDIVDSAMAAKNLTTLVTLLQDAGLVETLKGSGPFTVFAPDNRAFSRLPAGQLNALKADPAKLKTILTYHVIPASVDAATAMSMSSPTSPPTIEGDTLQVTKGRGNTVMINDAHVTQADIHASNGIIHIVDKVLMPPMSTMTP